MKKSILFSVILLAVAFQVKAQQDDAIVKVDSLSEVVVTANRINLPFKENSRTIKRRMGSFILNVSIWKVNCIADYLIPIF